MTVSDGLIAPLGALIDTVVPDPHARDAARLALLRLQGSADLDAIGRRIAASVTRAPPDPWTRRARPAFLYVMYALLLWSIPMGLIAAFRPGVAAAIAQGMTAYLNGIPEPLYALFGTGYLGYTAARSWGKARGVER